MTNPKDLNIKNAINENCPWSGNPIDEGSLTTYKGQVIGFCNTGCRDKFEKAVDLSAIRVVLPRKVFIKAFTSLFHGDGRQNIPRVLFGGCLSV